eukprot:473202_1
MVSLIHVQIRMTTILVQIPISNPKHTHVLQSLKALDKTQQLDKKNYPHCDECEKATPHTVDTIITPGDTLFVTLARHKKHLWPSRYMQKDPRHIKYCHHMKFKNRYYDLQAVNMHGEISRGGCMMIIEFLLCQATLCSISKLWCCCIQPNHPHEQTSPINQNRPHYNHHLAFILINHPNPPMLRKAPHAQKGAKRTQNHHPHHNHHAFILINPSHWHLSQRMCNNLYLMLRLVMYRISNVISPYRIIQM